MSRGHDPSVRTRISGWDQTWALALVFGLVSVPWTYAFVVTGVPLWPSFIYSTDGHSGRTVELICCVLPPITLLNSVQIDEIHHTRYRKDLVGTISPTLMVRFFDCGILFSFMSTETDAQGRLYIPKEVREKYGQKYHIVMYEDRIELIPVADDPLAAVREAAGELHGTSVEEIREDIESEAKDEAEKAGGDR